MSRKQPLDGCKWCDIDKFTSDFVKIMMIMAIKGIY